MVLKMGKVVALITGGTGGLGRATANHLIKKGAKVAMLDLPKDDINVEELNSDKSLFCTCDVTVTSDIMDAVEVTKSKFGIPNVLINCAGISTSLAVFNRSRNTPHNIDVFEDLINTNTIGTFDAIRTVVPEIIKNEPDEDGQRGVVINTSSIAAHEGEYGQVAYSASTAAVNAMTLPLSRDLCKHGIRVCTISVGYIDTPLLAAVPEKIRQFIISQIPFPLRLGRSTEYAMTAEAIISNSYLNAEIIRLDSGLRPIH